MFISNHHYLHLRLAPPKVSSSNSHSPTSVLDIDALGIRQTIHHALSESFGTTGGSIYLDVLWVSDSVGSEGRSDSVEVVIRVNPQDARNVLAALTATRSTTPQMQIHLVKESPFLPALLSRDVAF
ncbi:hypothetical protein BDP27DRAFT_1444219 [Rhodocollybia butyracea]|uniref:Ribonucleases P/MRP subunit Pop8-like domain-containing protein n=1 Tax=Rhodocollybia butyracea TaxID=206335 RepID=A0A9P5Q695_9AGAR|nr:hypothetical protein BDP27DRAFT_1444219 [Rhodocollybia butyracea]